MSSTDTIVCPSIDLFPAIGRSGQTIADFIHRAPRKTPMTSPKGSGARAAPQHDIRSRTNGGVAAVPLPQVSRWNTNRVARSRSPGRAGVAYAGARSVAKARRRSVHLIETPVNQFSSEDREKRWDRKPPRKHEGKGLSWQAPCCG
jgi:hypothetical protein